MNIDLRSRAEDHVKIYFERSKRPEIRAMIPQKATTIEEALDAYRISVSPGSTSYGRTIYADGTYLGDIWCYCIEPGGSPEAMVSYCIFEKAYWGQGIATKALNHFLAEIAKKFGVKSIGAFTYASNISSIRVLQKNGFREQERFFEDGVESVYFQLG